MLARIVGILKWIIALAIVGYLVSAHRNEFVELSRRPTDWRYGACALAIAGVAIALTLARWWLLVRAMDMPLSLLEAFRMGFLCYAFNFIGPGAVGGDLVKGGWLAMDHPTRKLAAFSTIVLDRVLGLLALFITGAVCAWLPTGLKFNRELSAVAQMTTLFAIGGTVGLLLILQPAVSCFWLIRWPGRWPIVGNFYMELLRALELYQARAATVWAAVGISLAGHVAMLSTFYFASRTVVVEHQDLPGYLAHLFFIPMAELAGIIPLTPGGIGLLEGAVSYLYGLCATTPESVEVLKSDGLVTCLVFRAVTIVLAGLGVAYYLVSPRSVRDKMNQLARRPEATATESTTEAVSQ